MVQLDYNKLIPLYVHISPGLLQEELGICLINMYIFLIQLCIGATSQQLIAPHALMTPLYHHLICKLCANNVVWGVGSNQDLWSDFLPDSGIGEIVSLPVGGTAKLSRKTAELLLIFIRTEKYSLRYMASNMKISCTLVLELNNHNFS